MISSKGVRISDHINNIISTRLSDILCVIQNPNLLNWAILYSDVLPLPNEGEFVISIEKQVNNSKEPYEISWDNLIVFSNKIHQEIDLITIGCRSRDLLKKYTDDEEMYSTCDIAIQMLDSSYWEVFSKDSELIDRLASKFKEIEFLNPDFEK